MHILVYGIWFIYDLIAHDGMSGNNTDNEICMAGSNDLVYPVWLNIKDPLHTELQSWCNVIFYTSQQGQGKNT